MPSPRSRSLSLALLVILAFSLLGAPPRSTAQAAALDGTWRFAGGAAERRGIARAIDAALSDLNPVMREIVASQLRESNQAYPQIVLDVGGDEISMQANGRTVRTPANGAEREVTTPEGRSARVSQRLAGDRLVQVLLNPQGTRTHTFSIDGEGHLVVDVRIHSTHLPRDVHYRLTYERVTP